VEAGQRVITPRGLAGLGWGFPMALGAKVAAPAADVVCLAGDGGFGHCWAELETAARTGTAVTLIVLNNGVLGYQKDAESVIFGRYTTACHFAPVDHAAIARACGVEGHRIERVDQLSSRLAAAISSNRPVLLEIITDPDAYPPVTAFDDQPALQQRSKTALR
jgi:acetolactate synthase I/II/III large subunit